MNEEHFQTEVTSTPTQTPQAPQPPRTPQDRSSLVYRAQNINNPFLMDDSLAVAASTTKDLMKSQIVHHRRGTQNNIRAQVGSSLLSGVKGPVRRGSLITGQNNKKLLRSANKVNIEKSDKMVDNLSN